MLKVLIRVAAIPKPTSVIIFIEFNSLVYEFRGCYILVLEVSTFHFDAEVISCIFNIGALDGKIVVHINSGSVLDSC